MGGDSAVDDATTQSKGVEEAVNINVRCSNGSKFTVQVDLESTVRSFKDLIAQNCNIPAQEQRLIYKGRILKDDQTLQSFGLEADHAVHLVRSFVSTNTNGGTYSSGTNTTTNNARGAGANDGGGLEGLGSGAAAYPGVGIRISLGEGFPEQMQQPFDASPNLVREIMNTPAMQNLINNPEILRNLIMNSPQMQELMDRNPELAHILNDPNTLRQTLEATRNPEIMREMMRNTDRAMSNIESSPEGFNMLRRMYENVQEPFLNATTVAGNTGISGPPGGQARDQSTNPSTTSTETTAGSPLPNTNPLPNPWSSTGSLEADHPVHLDRSFAPTNRNGGTNNNGTNTTTNNARGAGANDGGGLGGLGSGASPFPGLGISIAFGEGFPEQMQEPFIASPNLVREIMNTPAMQNLINNPEILRNFIMNNPQMQELMDRNPELAHILNDPNTLRQTLEATRNPEIMREMMRNTDRAMSNIESSPEGFNMLRRMYENVQEPFLNATTMAGNTGISGAPGVQARDQSTNPSTTGSETTAGSPLPNTNPLPNPWSSTGTGGAQNNTRRSTTGGDARQQAPTGLGGLGLPDLEGMLGGNAMPDAASLTQLMQNPAISQMMQSILSNPQALSQILGANTEQRGMPDLNSLREVMQNPEFLRLFSSPEALQQLLSFQQALLSQLGQQQSTRESRQTGGGPGSLNNLGLEMLSSMFGGLGAGSLAVPNRSNVSEPPEQLYAAQLSQLQEMGFFDTQENIRALIATSGNVHAAVERLLGNSGQ